MCMLSMPEQQLVEIARALGADAQIVIMDEPTASLSDKEVDRLFRVIVELKSHAVGIIYISHRLEELPQIADRVTALRDGVLVGTRPMADVSRGELIRMMVGRELSAVFPKTFVEPGRPVLEVRGLANVAAGVRGVSLSVRAGEILGLAGLVGAGRTELARVLFGLTPAESGEIRLRGHRVVIDSPHRAAALGVAYVPEDRRRHGVILEMTTAANTTLATLAPSPGWASSISARRTRSRGDSFISSASRPRPLHASRQPLGRQPAKGGAGALAGGKPGRSHPRRADPGGGRRGQGRDPPPDERAGRARAGDRDDLVRAARDPGHERPDRRDEGRHDCWDARTRAATQEAILDLALGHTGKAIPAGKPAVEPGERGKTARLPAFVTSTHRRELSVAVAYALLLLILAVAAPRFFRADSLRAFVVSSAPVLVAAVGMTLVILCRQIDISIGSIFSICGVVAGLLARSGCPSRWWLPEHWPPAPPSGQPTASWSRGWACRRSW